MSTRTWIALGGIVLVGAALYWWEMSQAPVPPLSAPPAPATGAPSLFAQAIAFAEGFGADPGNQPTRKHNPGDLTDSTGTIQTYPDDAAGWLALDHQLALIRTGASRVYDPTMTITEMAARWTATAPDAWAANVVTWFQEHGVSDVTPDTVIAGLL